MVPASMMAINARGAGDADVLHAATVDRPRPAPGEVLIRVLAAGVNRPDVQQRKGAYPPPADASPLLGLEVAGEVVAVNACDQWRPGDKVCALVNGGGYAEYSVAPAGQCLRWPAGYDAIRAAALPETFFTVWANLFRMGELAAGEAVLVHGGASGIGTTAIQLAAARGCSVFITAGSAEKCARALELGACAAINYHEADFENEMSRLTADLPGGPGVHVVLDMVGGPYTMRNLRCLRMDGRLVQIATMQGAKVPDLDLRLVMARRLRITGSTMRPRSTAEKAAIARALVSEVWPLLDSGRCVPVIDRVFPLADAAAAHRYMEDGRHVGKIMLAVA